MIDDKGKYKSPTINVFLNSKSVLREKIDMLFLYLIFRIIQKNNSTENRE